MAQKTWFYNDISGRIIHIGNALLAAVQEKLPAWHAFATKADAEAYKKGHKASVPIIGQAADAAGSAVKSVDVGGFLGALTNSNTWLRVAEVTLGIVLIVVGLVKLAPPSVKSAAKVAALL